jgi:gliding motility-associated-like protein
MLVHPSCTDPTGSITINAVLGETYSFDGGPYTTIVAYSGLQQSSSHSINAQNSFGCISTVTVTLDAQPPTPVPAIEDGAICVDETTGIPFQTYTLDTLLDPATHTFQWYYNGGVTTDTGKTLEATVGGLYGVIATNTFGCASVLTNATVIETTPGLSLTTTVEGQFSNSSSIIVTVNSGNAHFSYLLDHGLYQDSNVFTNVAPGIHTIIVTDTNGCTNLTTTVLVLGYPNFFTPNDDTYNDTWNIIGLNNQPDARIHIYDRYGKYIKQISPSTEGWDGTMNGHLLPSTDYWFTVEYKENGKSKEFKSHFSLVR